MYNILIFLPIGRQRRRIPYARIPCDRAEVIAALSG